MGGFASVLFDQRNAVARELEAGAQRIHSIHSDLEATLAKLNAEVSPTCGEGTLRLLRTRLVHTSYIADLGVVDSGGAVVCNSTAGVLEHPATLGSADFIGKSAQGFGLQAHFSQVLPGVDSPEKTLIYVSGSFTAAPPGDVLTDLLIDSLSAVQLARTNGVALTALVQPDLPAGLRELLVKPGLLTSTSFFYDWQHAAFFAVQPIAGTFYVAQKVVPLSAFVDRYARGIAWITVLSFFVGFLVYYALRPIFLSWRALEYRIHNLMVPGNLLCMYQPIIDLATGRPSGCEVLMRLRDGDAIISPDEAIPIIVKRGLTWELDRMVVKKAVGELVMFLPELVGFKVAFNFFPSSVSGGRIGDMVDEVLRSTPHMGLHFDVEVLEQEYKESMIQAIAELRARKFLVSVDDFGTGFSNLGSIKALLPDFLKIDRSFVHDMESVTLRSSLIPEIIGIGRAVGAKLIAEGIENERQYAALKDMGVEYGQGYFMCKPLPIDKFADYMAGFTA